MSKKHNITILISAIILSLSMITCSYMLTKSNAVNILKSSDEIETNHNNVDDVLNLDEVAEYLKMDKEVVLKIILIEQSKLSETGSFSGEMFPYFKVDDNYFIYKENLRRWLEDVTLERRVYETDTNTVF
ncbi:MerR family transcriptional regulator [Vallitalea okinawensis]|uniref:hypothetical protein n=1 Tax=Vallitalea okinawensis TaxID=2078660 RepID=UPI000CFCFEB5|nr:hypothetical protein [Vallitalea okinawensis]